MKKHKFCPQCKSVLSIKRVDGLDRVACSACGWIHYANPLPSSVAFVLRDGNELLLVKRGVPPGKGKWALPSGFIEAGELPQETVLRELKEETGIKGTISHLIGVYTEPTRMYGNVLLIAYDIRYSSGKPRARTDSIDARFFPLNKIPRIPFASHRRIIHDGLRTSVANSMNVTVLKSKITEATITHTKLFYKGSMGIDGAVMKKVKILPGEKVHVLNYDNGERLETYTIEEKPGSGRIVLYGPASRKGEVGQRLCILSYATITYDSAGSFKPKVVTLDSKNRIRHR
jgi:8-oxo-dGTP diphosphatase